MLALAVTAIETALILSMVMAGGNDHGGADAGLDLCGGDDHLHGVVGICILVGGIAHREQTFRSGRRGWRAGCARSTMASLTLILPAFTSSPPAGIRSSSQLAFVAVSSAVFGPFSSFVQTVRHQDYFAPAEEAENPDEDAHPPTTKQAWASLGMLVVALVAVVGSAKMLSPTIEKAVEVANAPRAVVGIVIAGLVLLPETWAAVRAARANRLQNAMNLAIGSALACIGLTVPAVVVASSSPWSAARCWRWSRRTCALLVLTFSGECA